MNKDYRVPYSMTIKNTNNITIDIKLDNLVDAKIKPNETLKINLDNSEQLALLKARVKELDLKELNIYKSKEKLADYLYKLEFDELDKDFARRYIKENYMKFGGCTSVRKDNLYGRNYDWFYDYSNNFVSYITETEDRIPSISVSSFPNKLTKEMIDSDEYSDLYKVIPYLALDGINKYGVVANINVTSEDLGVTKHSTPLVEERDNIGFVMIIRYILDNFQTAKAAGEYIRDYISLTSLKTDKYVEELHLMIGDPNETYLLEVIDGVNTLYKMEDTFSGRTFMTNFHLTDTSLDNEGHIDYSTVVPHGMGLERYNLIIDNFNSIENEADMEDLMHNKLRYTNAYDETMNPFWKTELCHNYGEPYGDLTVTTPLEQFEPVIDIFLERYEHRTREAEDTWQTVHSSIYNMTNKTLTLFVQEQDTKYEFELEVN